LVDIYDVVVIGAGISGSISANLLAQKGYKVIILERMQLPGYHLSENILKVNHPIFRKLGVEDEIKEVIKNKYSVGYAFNNSNMTFKLTFEQTNEDSKVLSWVDRIAYIT
jgi:flavin-dependent dehydrogenase